MEPAPATGTSKEARRRRIVDRGSDRLALITGRIQTLQPSSSFTSPKPQDSSLHSYQASCPPFLSDQSNSVFSEDENAGLRPSLQKCESSPESGPLNKYVGGSQIEPNETRSEPSKPSALESVPEVPPSFPISSTPQVPLISSSSKEPHFDPITHLRKIFNPNQINSAIAATENTRFYCSLLAAILVVLSCIGFPMLSSNFIKNTLFSKPLYLLLLTNISMVLAILLGKQQGGKERPEQGRKSPPQTPPTGGNSLFDNLGFALESGLVLQKVVGALFMDCSVYAVALVCSFSLAQKLGL